ncbi:hypothetical protein [Streptomyces sp. ME19-01-6]|uniref:hypothetical protein n=1 Tax=Streptomyces sp. ME19-01-6 TaxID=3028686 RepID=UPI0029A6FD57|nr:hypothetical protein [Streptomyces sp. ME19-01-6]MDX3229192.1 hypothetical protein [Streptomyces sp. ME19-01-6]
MPGDTRARRVPRGLVVALVLVTTLAAGVLTGCSRGTAPPPEPPPSLAELKARLPLYRFLYALTADDVRVSEARQRLIAACMDRHGFRYTPPPAPRTSDHATSYPAPFGLEPADLVPPAVPEEPRGEAYVRALYGDPDKRISATDRTLRVTRPATGCQADAEERLLSDGRVRWLTLRLRLDDGEKQSRGAIGQSVEFRAVGDRWQRCMRQAGFDDSDPVALQRDLPAEADARTGPRARADLRCKESTGYLTTAYTVLGAAQRAWLTEHPTVERDWTALRDRQIRAAHDALGAAAPR